MRLYQRILLHEVLSQSDAILFDGAPLRHSLGYCVNLKMGVSII